MTSRVSFLALVVIALFGCGRAQTYEGDGVLTDHGAGAANNRYVLNLGRVAGSQQFRLIDLPSEEFVLGLQVVGMGPDAAQLKAAEAGATVKIVLTQDGAGDTILEFGPLEQWTWTCGVAGCDSSFAYLREEVPVVGSARRSAGTFFAPTPGAVYRLEVELADKGDFFTGHEVELVARGGGWK